MSGMFGCDLTDNYLDTLYDTFSKEQMRLLTDMKNTKDADGEVKQQDIQKQLSFLNTLMINTLRLRNLKKKISLRANV